MLSQFKGKYFMYKDKPYRFIQEVKVRLNGEWLRGIEYEAQYNDNKDIKWGDRFVRLEIESENEEFIKTIILDGRREGNTTRLVDYYIQELFNNPTSWIHVVDHYGSVDATKLLMQRIRDRMSIEHEITILINYGKETRRTSYPEYSIRMPNKQKD